MYCSRFSIAKLANPEEKNKLMFLSCFCLFGCEVTENGKVCVSVHYAFIKLKYLDHTKNGRVKLILVIHRRAFLRKLTFSFIYEATKS